MILFGVVFASVGAVFLGIALWQGWSPRWRALSETAVGRVVANKPEEMSEGDIGYVSVVRFTARDGRDFEIDSRVISKPPAFEIGDQVKVNYDPARPDAAKLDTFWERWFPPTIFGVLGLVLSAIGFAAVIFRHSFP